VSAPLDFRSRGAYVRGVPPVPREAPVRPSGAALALLVILSIVTAALAAEAQQAAKVVRLGYLSPSNPTAGEDPQVEVPASRFRSEFREALRRHGWLEGQNLRIEYRFARGQLERLQDLAAELAQLDVDLIFAETGTAAKAAIQATSTIPTVFMSGDAVAQGLTSSLIRPDRNSTGMTSMSPDTVTKRLKLLKEALPRSSRVGVLRCPGPALDEATWRTTQDAARSLSLELVSFEVRSRQDVDAAFATAANNRTDALFFFDCGLFNALGSKIMTQHRLPSMYTTSNFAEAGGLMAYGYEVKEASRRLAWYVDRILRGAKPGELPIEQPTRFELVINLKTAKALRLTIPPSLLGRADQVIE
jgi:putative ABC transport system substrate-binding protein